jgi:hypothetical protein
MRWRGSCRCTDVCFFDYFGDCVPLFQSAIQSSMAAQLVLCGIFHSRMNETFFGEVERTREKCVRLVRHDTYREH